MAKVDAPVKFEPNGYYEHLIELRRVNRKAFDSLSPQVKFSLAHYERAKLKAQESETMK